MRPEDPDAVDISDVFNKVAIHAGKTSHPAALSADGRSGVS